LSEATHGGKGDKLRPMDKPQFDENYDRIFGKCKACGSQCSIGKAKDGVCEL